jgi:hypothetical protein
MTNVGMEVSGSALTGLKEEVGFVSHLTREHEAGYADLWHPNEHFRNARELVRFFGNGDRTRPSAVY